MNVKTSDTAPQAMFDAIYLAVNFLWGLVAKDLSKVNEMSRTYQQLLELLPSWSTTTLIKNANHVFSITSEASFLEGGSVFRMSNSDHYVIATLGSTPTSPKSADVMVNHLTKEIRITVRRYEIVIFEYVGLVEDLPTSGSGPFCNEQASVYEEEMVSQGLLRLLLVLARQTLKTMSHKNTIQKPTPP